jgi:hypothetical protein
MRHCLGVATARAAAGKRLPRLPAVLARPVQRACTSQCTRARSEEAAPLCMHPAHGPWCRLPAAQEVAICFGGRLLRGNRSRKVNSSAYAAFDSPAYYPLAVLGVDVDWRKAALLQVRAWARRACARGVQVAGSAAGASGEQPVGPAAGAGGRTLDARRRPAACRSRIWSTARASTSTPG